VYKLPLHCVMLLRGRTHTLKSLQLLLDWRYHTKTRKNTFKRKTTRKHPVIVNDDFLVEATSWRYAHAILLYRILKFLCNSSTKQLWKWKY